MEINFLLSTECSYFGGQFVPNLCQSLRSEHAGHRDLMLMWSPPFKAGGQDGHGGPCPAGSQQFTWEVTSELRLWGLFCEMFSPGVATFTVRNPGRIQKTRALHQGFPGDSEGKESTCNARGLGSVPGLGRCPGQDVGVREEGKEVASPPHLLPCHRNRNLLFSSPQLFWEPGQF